MEKLMFYMGKLILSLGVIFICTFVLGIVMLFNGIIKQEEWQKNMGSGIAALSLLAIVICILFM